MTEKTSLYASIVLPVPLNTPFTYAVPQELSLSVEVGRRALVPFGKRILTGFIINILTDPGGIPLSKLKPILNIIDDEQVFDTHMLTLARWVAEYYFASLGEVLKTAMPYGTMIKSRIRVHLVKPAKESDKTLTSRQREVLEQIRKKDHTLLRNFERSSKEPVLSIIYNLEKKGFIRIEREVNVPSVRPKTTRYIKPAPSPPEILPKRSGEQIRCIETLVRYPEGISVSEFLERFGFSRYVVNTLVNAGWAHYEEVEVTRRTKMLEQETIDVDHPLTEEQYTSFLRIMEECTLSKPRPVLLKGVTGSGKTRVYIEIVREMLAKGKGAIILVPEISLTPQTTRFFSSVFPGRVAVMHSAMSPGERYDMWRMINNRICDVVIGPRSAVFAPLNSPGVIIVDEEHDASYKQTDNAPRYNARDVAVMRGSLLGIPVVLGSATPSIESWYNASTGKYILCTLSKRVLSRPLPTVKVVDMRRERTEGNLSSLSRLLRDELSDRIRRREKSIILINRRGFATAVQCRSCGKALTCPNCAVALTYHLSKRLAICHLCGHEQLILEHCPHCGSVDLQHRGTGTQRIEKELASMVKPDSIVRMDHDTTRAHDAHYRLLEEFRTGGASILLGTQMVAKGLDIPEVTLVGIISADSSMYLPDFRAGERTYQLITQVAGRAGRGDIPGIVILQTYNPDNYAITAATRVDFETFAQSEIEAREDVGFPPFSHLVLIKLSSQKFESLQKKSEQIARFLSENAPYGTEVMGPVDAPISRVKGRYRIHILVKSSRMSSLLPFVQRVIEMHHKSNELIEVDVDPIDFM